MSRIDNFSLFNLTLHVLLLSEFARMRSRCLADSYRSRWICGRVLPRPRLSFRYLRRDQEPGRSDKPLKVDFRELVRMARTALFAIPLAP